MNADSIVVPKTNPTSGAKEGKRRWVRPLVALLGLGAVVATVTLLPVTRWLVELVEWIRAQGAAGVLVFAGVYVGAAALLLPGSVLTIGAGFAYGPLWGVALVSPVSVLAATVAFLLGRTVARDWVAGRVLKDPRFAAIDAAVGESGFKIVLLLRLSPLFPFNLLNYALGLMRVRLRDFVLGSWLGMLPGTALYVYIGSLITNASELASGTRPSAGWAGQALFVGGLLSTLAVTIVVTRIARAALKRALAQAPKSEKSST